MVLFREEWMGSLCGIPRNTLHQLMWASIVLAKGWSLLNLLDLCPEVWEAEAHPQPLLPAQPHQLVGSRHLAFGSLYNASL